VCKLINPLCNTGSTRFPLPRWPRWRPPPEPSLLPFQLARLVRACLSPSSQFEAVCVHLGIGRHRPWCCSLAFCIDMDVVIDCAPAVYSTVLRRRFLDYR
jgi:hypothetical protein